ncbi:13679_t:CDS:2 [Acaulospora colombiana]|uniref:13679_t:CDS:1 n=1 Tax=Acaulospora colombiana TaxID=27376 RepID=A0ACA9MFI9_9GLOM|nr:13679_t:CDS:2 [Acaulospora colombiana]
MHITRNGAEDIFGQGRKGRIEEYSCHENDQDSFYEVIAEDIGVQNISGGISAQQPRRLKRRIDRIITQMGGRTPKYGFNKLICKGDKEISTEIEEEIPAHGHQARKRKSVRVNKGEEIKAEVEINTKTNNGVYFAIEGMENLMKRAKRERGQQRWRI